MNRRRSYRVEAAQNDVIGYPYDREPTRPVGAAKHEHSSNDRQQPNDECEHSIICEWVAQIQFGNVSGDPDYAGKDVDPAHDRYRNGTFCHAATLQRTFMDREAPAQSGP